MNIEQYLPKEEVADVFKLKARDGTNNLCGANVRRLRLAKTPPQRPFPLLRAPKRLRRRREERKARNPWRGLWQFQSGAYLP